MKKLAYIFIITFVFTSCGGGGGGGGSSSSGRSTETAIRIIHGGIESTPYTLKVASNVVQTARFAQVTEFVPVENNKNVSIRVERANEPSVGLLDTTFSLDNETEYSVFISGSVSEDRERAQILVESVSRPEKGRARVRLLNALQESSSLRLIDSVNSIGPVSFGGASDFVEVNSGLHEFEIKDSGGYSSRITVELADRGELSVLVTGSLSLGVSYVKLYPDLD